VQGGFIRALYLLYADVNISKRSSHSSSHMYMHAVRKEEQRLWGVIQQKERPLSEEKQEVR